MHSLERQLIRVELTQRREEGCDVSAFEGPVQAALADENTDEAVFSKLYDELDALQPASSFPYEEPSELEAIRALRPDGSRRMDLDLTDDGIRDRIHGAWLGRAAGCSLGKPVEGWPRKRIDDYLESMGALPLDDYIPFKEGSISVGDTGGLPGTWTLDLQWGKAVLTVNEDLSGQVEYTAYDEVSKIRDVRVDGKRVRFVFGMHKGETEVDVEFVGTISGDRLSGEWLMSGFEFPLTAVRRT